MKKIVLIMCLVLGAMSSGWAAETPIQGGEQISKAKKAKFYALFLSGEYNSKIGRFGCVLEIKKASTYKNKAAYEILCDTLKENTGMQETIKTTYQRHLEEGLLHRAVRRTRMALPLAYRADSREFITILKLAKNSDFYERNAYLANQYTEIMSTEIPHTKKTRLGQNHTAWLFWLMLKMRSRLAEDSSDDRKHIELMIEGCKQRFKNIKFEDNAEIYIKSLLIDYDKDTFQNGKYFQENVILKNILNKELVENFTRLKQYEALENVMLISLSCTFKALLVKSYIALQVPVPSWNETKFYITITKHAADYLPKIDENNNEIKYPAKRKYNAETNIWIYSNITKELPEELKLVDKSGNKTKDANVINLHAALSFDFCVKNSWLVYKFLSSQSTEEKNEIAQSIKVTSDHYTTPGSGRFALTRPSGWTRNDWKNRQNIIYILNKMAPSITPATSQKQKTEPKPPTTDITEQEYLEKYGVTKEVLTSQVIKAQQHAGTKITVSDFINFNYFAGAIQRIYNKTVIPNSDDLRNLILRIPDKTQVQSYNLLLDAFINKKIKLQTPPPDLTGALNLIFLPHEIFKKINDNFFPEDGENKLRKQYYEDIIKWCGTIERTVDLSGEAIYELEDVAKNILYINSKIPDAGYLTQAFCYAAYAGKNGLIRAIVNANNSDISDLKKFPINVLNTNVIRFKNQYQAQGYNPPQKLTPLACAVVGNKVDTVKLLVEEYKIDINLYADQNLKNNIMGLTTHCTNWFNENLYQLLLYVIEKMDNKSINQLSDKSDTFLHFALFRNPSIEVISALTKKLSPQNLVSKNKSGLSAIDFAVSNIINDKTTFVNVVLNLNASEGTILSMLVTEFNKHEEGKAILKNKINELKNWKTQGSTQVVEFIEGLMQTKK